MNEFVSSLSSCFKILRNKSNTRISASIDVGCCGVRNNDIDLFRNLLNLLLICDGLIEIKNAEINIRVEHDRLDDSNVSLVVAAPIEKSIFHLESTFLENLLTLHSNSQLNESVNPAGQFEYRVRLGLAFSPENAESDKLGTSAGELRILLVEDEAPTCNSTIELLSMLGHKVVAVNCGHEALHLLDLMAPQFDLILCDMRLGGSVSGADVMELRNSLCPEIPFVFCTATPDACPVPQNVPVLTKPYSFKTLEQLCEDVQLNNFRTNVSPKPNF